MEVSNHFGEWRGSTRSLKPIIYLIYQFQAQISYIYNKKMAFKGK